MKRFFIFFTLLCISLSAFAGDKGGGFKRFDNAIRRFLMGGLDTNYIAISKTSFEVPMLNTLYGHYSIIPLESGDEFILETGVNTEIGIGAGYHGLDYIQTFALGSQDKVKSYFTFDFYDNYWGVNFSMSENEFQNYMIGASTLNITAYYAVNGNKYSYPASYYGNYRQKKSAGSPIVTCWYSHLHLWNTSSKSILKGAMDIDNVTLCAGYGYNWSFLEGRVVANLSGQLGFMAPYWGVAVQARGGAMCWITDNFRLNVAAIAYFEQGKRNATQALLDSEWCISMGFAYCFGKF